MAHAKATTIEQYMAGLPEDRRQAVEAIRAVINKNIDKAFEHGMQYGMPAWYVPHAIYPAGYHCDPKQPLPFASVASQKGHIGIYIFCIYQDEALRDWFIDAWKASGKRLDMGMSCIRVKKLDDVPLDVLGKLFKKVKAKDFVAAYEKLRPGGPTLGATKPAMKKAAKKTGKKTTKKPNR